MFLRRLFGKDGGGENLFTLCTALMRESGEYASTALAGEALDAYHRALSRTRVSEYEKGCPDRPARPTLCW